MKISFLIHTIYGIGGTIRTTLNLAEELVGRHEVEIVSVFRHRDIPLFDIDPRITVVPLIDTRPTSPANEKEHPLQLQAAEFFPRHEARYKEYSKLTDERVQALYAGSDADVVIGTRPGLSAYAAQFAPSGAVRIGQEHMTHNHHKAALRKEMYEHLDALDAYVTVSEGDAKVYREKMPLPATRVLAIPNSVPEPPVTPSDATGRTVVAAGRLAAEKQYHVLIDAFAKVVAARPEWDLRIYGWGPEKDKLRARIDRLGLYNSVRLMGPHSPIEPEWAKGAIAASTSRHESFGMTLVEAMRCGLPVVSTDCDYGPREILKDGEDGILVPVGDVDAVAGALLRLIDDEELRRTMGAAAVRNARRFDPGQVAKQYEELIGELRTAAAQRAEAGAFAPVADCVAEADGAVTVTLVSPQAAAVTHEGIQLVCVRADVRTDEHRFPFGTDGRAVIPADVRFAEGVWECSVQLPGSGRRVRIAARSIDQRGAMRARDRVERTGAEDGVRTLVPYPGKPKKQLQLRSWVRPVHAEAGEVRVADRRITVSGELMGPARFSGDPVLVLRRRGRESVEFTYPGSRLGERGFRFTFPATAPAARQTVADQWWDLLVRYAPDAEPARIGRVLDDVVEKGPVFAYPETRLRKKRPYALLRLLARRLRGRPQQFVRVRIAYTNTNDLLVNVVDVPVK
ncbi:glycosyltransferase family 4 protein [Streptomyces sp. SP18CS02]|uniref:glycosyltransferase family 4 protein n=1 Tax=Streptomyces sp. SP18CS02 TaxID=3002531 RepID=UPI002E75E13E|nr:glycosyltransferase family 4 protein [Streptomyces sp. SP18CS02]MEE1753472.1 glycosyltransferase family 4 protein [Streptomyces sp. SP18CS02]